MAEILLPLSLLFLCCDIKSCCVLRMLPHWNVHTHSYIPVLRWSVQMEICIPKWKLIIKEEVSFLNRRLITDRKCTTFIVTITIASHLHNWISMAFIIASLWSECNNKAVTLPTKCWHFLKCIQTGNNN